MGRLKLYRCSVVGAIALLCALVVSDRACAQLQQAQPNDTEQPAQPKGDDARAANPPNPIQAPVNLIGQRGGGQGNEEGNWYDPFREHTTEWLLALFSGLLVLYAARLAYATRGLVKTAQGQSEDLRASIAVARDAAAAATKSANIAESSLKDLERPYLYITNIEPDIKTNLGNPPGFRDRIPAVKCTIKNYGRTPAIIRDIEAQLLLDPDGPQLTMSIVRPRIVVLEQNGTHTFECSHGDVVPDARAEMVKTGAVSFWLHFRVAYEDIFGKSHQTPVKWQYSYALDMFSPEHGHSQYEGAT